MLKHKRPSLSWRIFSWRRPTVPVRRQCLSNRIRLGVEELESRIVPSLVGQQLFPANYPLNQNIANAPVLANSGAIMNDILNSLHSSNYPAPYDSYGVGFSHGLPINIVHGNSVTGTPVQDWHEYNGWYTSTVNVPIPSNAVVAGEQYGQPRTNQSIEADRQLFIWDENNNVEYDLYKASRPVIVHASLEDHAPGAAICAFNRDGRAHPSATAAMHSVK